MRIDKFFSSLGILSRSECKKAIKAGHIRIGGRPVIRPDDQIDPEKDQIFYKGSPVRYSSMVYYMLNKPAGVITANEDKRDKTVFDLIPDSRPDLSAVGRLDKDTTGILLITNDGQLNHKLLSAKYHVSKTYIARTDGVVSDEDIIKLEEGMDIGDEHPTLPAKARIIGSHESGSIVSLSICEGRYHQVKRMFSAIGKPVISLHRSAFGPLMLDDDLAPGCVRELNLHEIELLRSAVSSPVKEK